MSGHYKPLFPNNEGMTVHYAVHNLQLQSLAMQLNSWLFLHTPLLPSHRVYLCECVVVVGGKESHT